MCAAVAPTTTTTTTDGGSASSSSSQPRAILSASPSSSPDSPTTADKKRGRQTASPPMIPAAKKPRGAMQTVESLAMYRGTSNDRQTMDEAGKRFIHGTAIHRHAATPTAARGSVDELPPTAAAAAGPSSLLSPTLSSPTPSLTHPSWPHSHSCKLDLHGRSHHYWIQQRTRRLFQQPERITSFSFDEKRRLFHDDRSLKYFHLPPLRVDLARGMENLVERDPNRNEHLDSLLYSLMDLASQSDADPSADLPRRRADVITWRGMATKLFSALYEEQNDFSMNVMMVKDTLYIEEWQSPEEKARRAEQNKNERLRRFGYYGYAFESWCTHTRHPARGERVEFNYAMDDPWDGDVNTNVQWCSVVKTKLGDMRLILGGEVDCVDPNPRPAASRAATMEKDHHPPASPTSPTRPHFTKSAQPPSVTPQPQVPTPPPPVLVELKTSQVLRRREDEVRFEKKMLKFYLQSYLLGVEKVLVGFRDSNGILQTFHEFETLDMPKAVRGKEHAWDRGGCCNFAWSVLDFVRTRIKEQLELEERRQKGEERGGTLPGSSNVGTNSTNGSVHPSSSSSSAAPPQTTPKPPSTSTPSTSTSSTTPQIPVYRLDFQKPYTCIRLTRLEEAQVEEEIKGPDRSRVGFLPRDYYDFVMRSERVYT